MENNQLQHREHLTGLIATLTSVEASREFERNLTIAKIVESALPMSELKRHVGHRNVAIALDVQLTRLVASLNLKWNVNDSQIKDIVQDLIEEFPHESIEDFVLCFKKARKGQYGELIRLDSPIIFTWMRSYLEEKYQVVEENWKAKKEAEKKPIQPEGEHDWLKVWKEAVDSLPHQKRFDLTDEEINREGKEKPPKEKPYPITTPEEAYVRDRHFEWIKNNFEAKTGYKLPSWIDEESWNIVYDEQHLTNKGK